MMKEMRMEELELVNGRAGNTMSCDGDGSSKKVDIVDTAKAILDIIYAEENKPKFKIEVSESLSAGPITVSLTTKAL